jgi:rhodanese-related sulfurtransferase
MATKTASQLVTEARAQISNLAVDQVADELTAGQVVLVDLHEPSELAEHGAIAGAVHAPRGMLEFCADPTGASHLPALDQSARTILSCASGGRSALACALLGQRRGDRRIPGRRCGRPGSPTWSSRSPPSPPYLPSSTPAPSASTAPLRARYSWQPSGWRRSLIAQIDDQLVPRAHDDDLLGRHGLSDLGFFSLIPMHA